MTEIDILGGAFRDLIFYGDIHSTDFLEMPGGTGYNVFAGLRALHVEVYFHNAVGKDWPFEKLKTVGSKKSGVFISRNETKVLAVYRGANLWVKEEPLQSRVLFSTLECGGDTFEKYAENAKKTHATVILDPSPIFEWKSSYLELCDVLLPNHKELQYILRREKNIPPHLEIFTKLGQKGGMYLKGKKKYVLSVSKGGSFPLGCGDAFDVAILYALLKKLDAYQALKIAIEAGRGASFIRGSSTAVVKAAKALEKTSEHDMN